ncbi:CBS domain-containing protein [Microbacterium sp. APC 3898]|uniref:CBS domain-containing protein n=2 Tax=Planococcus TaxID=1372 RepID=A0ABT7ZKH8_9BACL|nr:MULTISPECIES: CBS domain-containing protein [Terrabacteria group]MBD8014706.1 CBS domain-containing protein [Planococcus wigleyi]MDN3427577.1 CBS domain-containing protein [Planococcus sp. APC 4016]MDN3436932.1 CBS domain-containing protein [Planococcus sp. APC 3900]MDN3499128.1 CBS domain-containing protein [Microbacterium sp. APC 3898]
MKIKEIMTTDVETCMPESTLQEVALKMREINVGSIPICEDGRLVGIVTDRDIVVRGLAEQIPSEAPISEILSAEVVTGTVDLTVEEAAEMMATHKIRRLPIVTGEQVIGIVSLGDLAIRDVSANHYAENTIIEISEVE